MNEMRHHDTSTNARTLLALGCKVFECKCGTRVIGRKKNIPGFYLKKNKKTSLCKEGQ